MKNDIRMFLNEVFIYRKSINETPEYNLFTVLLKEGDEVRLHSRFLSSLLDASDSAAHGCKSLLLKKFVAKVIDSIKDKNQKNKLINFSFENIKIKREWQNIDLLIDSAKTKSCIIIENKIWAGDQENQLARYHTIMRDKYKYNVTIIYLSLYGKRPANHTLCNKEGNLVLNDEDIICISYKDTIISWLNSCIGLVAYNPPVRESIFQYIKLLEKITGIAEGNKLINSVYEILVNDLEKLKLAEKIFTKYNDQNKINRIEQETLLTDIDDQKSVEVIVHAYLKYLKERKDIWHKFASNLEQKFRDNDCVKVIQNNDNDIIINIKNIIKIFINKIEQKHITIHYGCHREDNRGKEDIINKALSTNDLWKPLYGGRWIAAKKLEIKFGQNSLDELNNLNRVLENLINEIDSMLRNLIKEC